MRGALLGIAHVEHLELAERAPVWMRPQLARMGHHVHLVAARAAERSWRRARAVRLWFDAQLHRPSTFATLGRGAIGEVRRPPARRVDRSELLAGGRSQMVQARGGLTIERTHHLYGFTEHLRPRLLADCNLFHVSLHLGAHRGPTEIESHPLVSS